MEKVLIVDGHSAIYSTEWLFNIHADHPESGREALARELSELQNRSDFHVVLVFDGQGHKRSKRGGTDKDILIVFSRSNETADRVIERIVAQQGDKYDIQVASNDRMVLDSCSVSGAHVMSITNFWEFIDSQMSR